MRRLGKIEKRIEKLGNSKTSYSTGFTGFLFYFFQYKRKSLFRDDL